MMKKIFKIIYVLFLSCIGLIAILMLASVLPITGNYKLMIVQSGSMEPAIHTGSIVVVKPTSNYQAGDIITFGPNTKTKAPTTHRIADIKVENSVPIYITKGDANNAPDIREIKQSEIIGKVLFSVPFAGYAVAAAKKPAGFIVIIVVPAIIVIYEEVQKIWIEIKKAKAKKKEEKIET